MAHQWAKQSIGHINSVLCLSLLPVSNGNSTLKANVDVNVSADVNPNDGVVAVVASFNENSHSKANVDVNVRAYVRCQCGCQSE